VYAVALLIASQSLQLQSQHCVLGSAGNSLTSSLSLSRGFRLMPSSPLPSRVVLTPLRLKILCLMRWPMGSY
jgi:hypothetical protein